MHLRKHSLPTVSRTGVVLSFVICGYARGQVNLVDQTRSLSISAGYIDTTISGLAPVDSDSFTVVGPYTNSFTDSITNQTVTNGNPQALDQAVLNLNTSAGQTSVVSPSLFSGTGSASAAASIVESLGQWSANTSGQSIYNVDFTVSSPTPFNISGSVSTSANYHVGPLELATSSITLTSSLSITPVYSISISSDGTAPPLNDPVSFATTLEPDQIYTLNAEAFTHANKAGSGAPYYAPSSANFSFSASVPEPTTLLVSAASLMLLRRTRRSSRQSS